jgi:predicted methyltransferase
MNTLLLDRTIWDLCLDINGNIAMATDPYSLAQDVASAVRTFAGEAYYDTTQGLPYFNEILGQRPPMSVIKAAVVAAALSIPEVQSARCIIASFSNRVITGMVEVIDSTGQSLGVSF